MALKGMKHEKAMKLGEIPVEVWESLDEEKVCNYYVVVSVTEDIRARENANGVERERERERGEGGY